MSAPCHDVPIWAIIPAAGLGRRMGRPKQTLTYGGSTLTGTVARCLLKAGVDRVVVVTRASFVSALGLPDDARVQFALNEIADSDMIDSIRIGLATIAVATTANRSDAFAMDPNVGVLVVPGDMPLLSVKVFRKCMHAFETDPCRIVVATNGQRRGHPIVFPLALHSAVNRLHGGLNELPRRHANRVYLVENDDPAVTRDVDSPDEYEELLSQNSNDKTVSDEKR